MDVVPHYVRRNHSARVPTRHVSIDTEATRTTDGRSELQGWLLGHAIFSEYTPAGVWRRRSVSYSTPDALWADITQYARPRRRTVIWAHNLAYDLRISRAIQAMAMLGWTLVDIRLSSQGTWVRWESDGRTLVGVDSFSVWPTKLATIGAMMGVPKMGYDPHASIERMSAYCQRDAEILATAVERYTCWLRDADLGNWQLTGAGQAWAHWRHRHLTHNILVGDTVGSRDMERRAMWTGRAEAYRVGENPTETVYDWDWENSYARICRDVSTPVAQHSIGSRCSLDVLLRSVPRYAILAQVRVRTEYPCVPAEHDGHILWPIGDFSTTLWDPELCMLAEHAEKVQVERVVYYKRGFALREWAQSIIADLHRPDTEVPGWQKTILKHWSRALIGRFAMRYRVWEDFATLPEFDLTTFEGHDWETGIKTAFLQVGRELKRLGEEEDPTDSAPFVTGYVMSVARARLWQVGQAIGWEHVLYVDTDSLLVDGVGNRRLIDLAGDPRVDGLRLKHTYRGWAIAGPRQLVLGGEPHVAGVPKSAVQVGPWAFEGESWRGLQSSLTSGEHDQVRVTSRTFHVHGRDRRREHTSDGATVPIRLPRSA